MTINKITSKDNPLIKRLTSLNDKTTRNQEKLFIVEGYHLVEEARIHQQLIMVLATDPNDLVIEKNHADFNHPDFIERYLITDQILNKITKTVTPQKIIGVCRQFDYDFEMVIQQIKANQLKTILILDDISDPGNLGTIIRCASSFKVDLILTSLDTVDLYNQKVIRSTQGAIFKTPLVKTNLYHAIKILKDHNFNIYVTNLTKATDLKSVEKKFPLALVMGNEAHGVSLELIKEANHLIKIPMKSGVESLNVGVATGIILYEFLS